MLSQFNKDDNIIAMFNNVKYSNYNISNYHIINLSSIIFTI